MKIGVAISTHNRKETFYECYNNWVKLLPKDAVLIVVDDFSDDPIPEANYRFNTNVGIAATKNKCIELLYANGVTDFFLTDDDTFPIHQDWYKPYIDSRLNHAMYSWERMFNGEYSGNKIIKRTDKYTQYANPCGCMLYFKRICFDIVGGMDQVYGIWGHEHADLSRRIFNCGLTPGMYLDAKGSTPMFHAHDFYQTVERSVETKVRVDHIKKNKPIFDRSKFSKDFIPFKQMNNIVITTYFTSIKDPQRNENWECNPDDLSALIESLKGEKLVVLHDCLDSLGTENITYIKVKTTGNPYFARWEHILKHLKEHEYDFVFCVDATDVQMLKSPFDKMTGFNLYTGDEPCIINNQWLKTHHNTPLFTSFIHSHAGKQLLNAGLLGGKREIVIKFLEGLVQLNKTETNVLGDMAAFNYIAYTYFRDILMHGRIVNTIFKQYKSNTISWFKHK